MFMMVNYVTEMTNKKPCVVNMDRLSICSCCNFFVLFCFLVCCTNNIHSAIILRAGSFPVHCKVRLVFLPWKEEVDLGKFRIMCSEGLGANFGFIMCLLISSWLVSALMKCVKLIGVNI